MSEPTTEYLLAKATLPLTIPIGSTIEAYERAGHNVGWGWDEANE